MPSTPTLFLDIDGVINSQGYLDKLGKGPRPDPRLSLDPSAILHVNRVVEETGCRVVLSSDWRREPRNPGWRLTGRYLRARGATFDLFGGTPVLTDVQRQERFGAEWSGNYTPRGWEIQWWIDEHPDTGSIAIVDDCADMAHLQGRCVVTDWDVGITDEDAEALIRLLREEPQR